MNSDIVTYIFIISVQYSKFCSVFGNFLQYWDVGVNVLPQAKVQKKKKKKKEKRKKKVTAGVQFRSSLRESNLIATITITIGSNEGSSFSCVDATQIITGIDSLIIVKYAALD